MGISGYIIVNDRTGEILADWPADIYEMYPDVHCVDNKCDDKGAQEVFVDYMGEFGLKDSLSLHRAVFHPTKNDNYLIDIGKRLA